MRMGHLTEPEILKQEKYVGPFVKDEPDPCDGLEAQDREEGKTKKREKNEYVLEEDHCLLVLYNKKGVECAEALVDVDDVPEIVDHKWCQTAGGYAISWIDGKIQYLHHIITGHHPNRYSVVDHINGNTLDNRKENLRVVSRSINAINSEKNLGETSIYRGVYFDKSRGRWCARLIYNGEMILFKRCKTEEEARDEYQRVKEEVLNGL